MNALNNVINRINYLINSIPEKVTAIPESEMTHKPKADKWSKKEILGHLCDSAFNNHSRFTRAQFEPQPFVITRYEQNEWVKLNGYQKMKTEDVTALWITLNSHIVNVIAIIPEAKLAILCDLGDAAFQEGDIEKTLLWLIEDYLIHLEYHLKQIVSEI